MFDDKSISMNKPVFETNLKSLQLLNRGKVRDLYLIDEDRLLIVQTDRISAFDTVLPSAIPGKGKVLTEMSKYWFKKFSKLVPNHYLEIDPLIFVEQEEYQQVEGRALVVKKLIPIQFEAVVRGYLAGSGWEEYQTSKSISGESMESGLDIGDKLHEPLFTPSTKANLGEHDINISFEQMVEAIGMETANIIKDKSIQLYENASSFCVGKGLILADTKFEFGLDDRGQVFLIDEILTPDSSRFWSVDTYETGKPPLSFDKQYVRDWLNAQDWDKSTEPPPLPENIIMKTQKKYCHALKIICG